MEILIMPGESVTLFRNRLQENLSKLSWRI
jgi:hypothetical protein